jgi:hypothetical protein
MRTFYMLLVAIGCSMLPPSAAAHPAEAPDLTYSAQILPGSDYDPAVPTLEKLLGFTPGKRIAAPAEIESVIEAFAGASPRVRVFEYAKSYEGRGLYYVAISDPDNIARLDEIRDGWGKIADPRDIDADDADQLLAQLPSVAWMAYSIHGNETSGADAALALIYHLAAARDAGVRALLRNTVVLVDPMMNPDGRHRTSEQLSQHRGHQPNVDDQSLLHTGYWPWGRTNHYLFDLNRDWIFGVNPESRGRIAAAGSWHPLLFVDAHEMGAQDTFLFSPPRDPHNPHVPPALGAWVERFAEDQAKAFDANRWPYYTGEWNEGWYPGYSNAWAAFRGAVGMLYEQASVDEDGVRRPDGSVLTYTQAIHHQLVSSLANLETLYANADALKRDFIDTRRAAVSANGPYARRSFAILPNGNLGRTNRFLDLMTLQGIEVYRLTQPLMTRATDALGRSDTRRLPAGTLIVPNRQPEANLVATLLEFDPRMPEDTLQKERRELLVKGESRLYDVTAWNITMMYGLDALELPIGLPPQVEPATADHRKPAAVDGKALAYVFDGRDDRSVAVAARLATRGVTVRVAGRAFALDGKDFARGSVIATGFDNRDPAALAGAINEVSTQIEIAASAIESGWGPGDAPDLGGGYFQPLAAPSVAVIARGGIAPYDYGNVWKLLDQDIGIRHSQIDEALLEETDLRRYNVIVLPDRWQGELDEASVARLNDWVAAGGTLVAIGDSAAQLALPEKGLEAVRVLPEALDELQTFELAVLREAMARQMPRYSDSVWSHAVAMDYRYPWSSDDDSPEVEELEKRDEWLALFMPQGAFVAARVDDEHWLSFGTPSTLPVLYGEAPVLFSAPPAETPVRLGVFREARSGEDDDQETVRRAGWLALPDDQELDLRMSGLLWPEAAQRIAHGAYLVREAKGEGQVILFASPPSFRGATLGTIRLLANAIVYGPGFGSSQAIRP